MALKEIEIKDGYSIPFVDITKDYGRAEFIICQRYKNKRLVELYIYPAQQKNTSEYYVWRATGKGGRDFTIGCFHELEHPNIWLFGYCGEHKSTSFRVYVPTGSKFLYLSIMSSVQLYFTRTRIK